MHVTTAMQRSQITCHSANQAFLLSKNISIPTSILPVTMTSSNPPKGHFNILFFAAAGSFTSKHVESLPAPLPLKKLFETLEERYKGIKESILDHSLVTINLTYVDMPSGEDDGSEELIIKEGDEVAIIPPVSSG
ncbi:hypothetical protein QBC46DRAFT_380813 [Diplogelasinospora grovesii]|uniref:Molybdopterin synthase sulfur carrier subunit n=1 Tax=Diplogelasinospora grovesii TaxID=303347 RepID=A0AAN6NAH2_9PEZI|nr:hypothetical protein QBC46DRAFT_380813 [Diplogelasinospora grovesii]